MKVTRFDRYIKETENELKHVYFCGCEVIPYITAGNKPFNHTDDESHVKDWNKEKLQMEYICFKNQVVYIEKYKIYANEKL